MIASWAGRVASGSPKVPSAQSLEIWKAEQGVHLLVPSYDIRIIHNKIYYQIVVRQKQKKLQSRSSIGVVSLPLKAPAKCQYVREIAAGNLLLLLLYDGATAPVLSSSDRHTITRQVGLPRSRPNPDVAEVRSY